MVGRVENVEEKVIVSDKQIRRSVSGKREGEAGCWWLEKNKGGSISASAQPSHSAKNKRSQTRSHVDAEME